MYGRLAAIKRSIAELADRRAMRDSWPIANNISRGKARNVVDIHIPMRGWVVGGVGNCTEVRGLEGLVLGSTDASR